MPEGDAVRRTARRLDTALAGSVLVRADLRVPRYATVDLAGAQVLGTGVVGKHLLTRVVREGRALTLHTHLRMDGRWATGAAGPRPVAGPAHQIRAWLATPTSQAVGLRIAMVQVLPTAEEHRLIGHLGPDILAADVDPDRVAARVAGQGARPLGESLLDQRVLCGLGTIWTAETGFHAGASPWTASEQVPHLAAALLRTRTAMLAAVAASNRAAMPRYAVYDRLGRPCRRCGTPIRSGRLGSAPTDRIAYWCPTCQPGPAGGAAAEGR